MTMTFQAVPFRNALSIIEEHRLLRLAFKYFMQENAALYAPYHNALHMLSVLKYTDWIIRNEKAIGEYEPDEADEISLLLAAIFHDMNHTAGRETDDVNVSNAKYAFNDFLSIVGDEDMREEWLKERVYKLIDATRFPYTIHASDLSHEQKILRDADLMQPFEDGSIYTVAMGLAAEMKMSPLTSMCNGVLFHRNALANTKTADMFRKAMVPPMLSELERYIKLLE